MSGNRDLFYFCIILAMILHFFAGEYADKWFKEEKKKQEQTASEKPIEVTPYDEKKQVVHTDRVEETEKSKNNKARFGGLFRNRTEKETQSAIKDKFRSGAPSAPKLPEEGNEKRLGGVTTMHDLMPFSSSPDEVPDDIARGNATVLNTDPVIYASFMERIADMIYDSWRRNFEQAVEDLAHQGKKLNADTYVTRIVVTMNRDGDVTAIEVVQSSGFPEIDDAPKKAFFGNAPFRNPPSQLVSKDGYIHLPYEFTIHLRGTGLNIAPWGI